MECYKISYAKRFAEGRAEIAKIFFLKEDNLSCEEISEITCVDLEKIIGLNKEL